MKRDILLVALTAIASGVTYLYFVDNPWWAAIPSVAFVLGFAWGRWWAHFLAEYRRLNERLKTLQSCGQCTARSNGRRASKSLGPMPVARKPVDLTLVQQLKQGIMAFGLGEESAEDLARAVAKRVNNYEDGIKLAWDTWKA